MNFFIRFSEAPYFINRPLPMQAVVQLNAPPNTPVFTLQARDPDTDHSIHYFIVRDRSKSDPGVTRPSCTLLHSNWYFL